MYSRNVEVNVRGSWVKYESYIGNYFY